MISVINPQCFHESHLCRRAFSRSSVSNSVTHGLFFFFSFFGLLLALAFVLCYRLHNSLSFSVSCRTWSTHPVLVSHVQDTEHLEILTVLAKQMV